MRRSLVLLCAFALACTEQNAPTAPRAPETPATDAADFVPPGVTEFLFAHHTATEEVPPTTSQAGGSTAIWFTGENTIAWALEIPNPAREQFNVGHIHGTARRGMNAGVVQFLLNPDQASNAERIFIQGSATISPDLARALRFHADLYYVNYHTTPFPGGAVRGQLEWRTND